MVEVRREQVEVCLGEAGLDLGSLRYVRHGRREHCAFAYEETWLRDRQRFNVSADLQLVAGHQPHKAASSADSVFHGALADTAPDAWGRRVIARNHAKERKLNPKLPALSEMDYLLAVDDFSRVGALRLRDPSGQWLSGEAGARRAPPLVELAYIFESSRAVERGRETLEDLRYLQGKGTSLGGMRPKCSILEEDGRLAIGKFPSVGDERNVTRCEVLALKLAAKAGVEVPSARVVEIEGVPVAVICRFDREPGAGRIPYQSAASMLVASRHEERSYLEIVDILRATGHAPKTDMHQLWRRLVFNLLITNVDDHLQNHGFLHVENGLWRLSPAFDLNPFPEKARESKVWLSVQDGPITEAHMLLRRAAEFSISQVDALKILSEVRNAVSSWRQVALSAEIGLKRSELEDIAPAFEHEQMDVVRTLLA